MNESDEKVDVNVLNYYFNFKALVLMFLMSKLWRDFVNEMFNKKNMQK